MIFQRSIAPERNPVWSQRVQTPDVADANLARAGGYMRNRAVDETPLIGWEGACSP